MTEWISKNTAKNKLINQSLFNFSTLRTLKGAGALLKSSKTFLN